MLCPLDETGDRCNLIADKCYPNPCRNNGTCLSTLKPNEFFCLCDDYHYGESDRFNFISIKVLLIGLLLFNILISIYFLSIFFLIINVFISIFLTCCIIHTNKTKHQKLLLSNYILIQIVKFI